MESYGYWVVFFGLTLDMMGLPFPGEIVLLWAGFLTYQGTLQFSHVVLVATAAVLIGESFTYFMGRLVGERGEKKAVEFYCRWTACTLGSAHCMEQAGQHLRRLKSWAFLFAKFLFGIRAFICPVAGMLNIPYRQFLLFDFLGTVVWSATFTFLGFLLGSQWHFLARGFARAQTTFGWITLLSVTIYLIFKIYKNRRYGSPPKILATSGRACQAVGCEDALQR